MIRRTLACALAIAGATAFVAAPPARAPTALCASHGKRGFKKLSLPALWEGRLTSHWQC